MVEYKSHLSTTKKQTLFAKYNLKERNRRINGKESLYEKL